MKDTYDVLVIGAGFAGAVTARELAQGGMNVLVLERRGHVAGNAYDCYDERGVLVHRYGPHIFHTTDRRVYSYLSGFTQWMDYQHSVVANIPTQYGRMEIPVPFNLVSLESVYGADEAGRIESKLIKTYGAEKKVTILELRQNPDPELSKLADYVYDHVFVHYTMKQWGQKPEDIDPATTARVPVFLSRDCRYFQDPYQGMPADGYTPMFERILTHPHIRVRLNTESSEHLRLEKTGTVLLDGEVFHGPVVYTGALDELYGCRYGRLPYRTLDFRFETYERDFYQSHGTVNYTADEDFTRITEFKHLTGQRLPGVTTIMKEYSRAYTGTAGEIPYYAVINENSNALYRRYAALAAGCPQLHLLGRLAEYKYYNMDAIVGRALDLANQILKG